MNDFPEKLGRQLDNAKVKAIDEEIGAHIGRSVLNSIAGNGWVHVSEERAQNAFAKAVAAGRLYQNELNSKVNSNRSEGIKRVCLIICILSVVLWAMFVLNETKDFSTKTNLRDWLIILAGIPISFYIPKLILKIGYWVTDGFRQNEKND